MLATWPTLLDAGRLQDGEPFLAGTAPRAVARLSADRRRALGVVDGDERDGVDRPRAVTVPVLVTDGMADHVVWLPTNSVGCAVRTELREVAGAPVDVAVAGSGVAEREGAADEHCDDRRARAARSLPAVLPAVDNPTADFTDTPWWLS